MHNPTQSDGALHMLLGHQGSDTGNKAMNRGGDGIDGDCVVIRLAVKHDRDGGDRHFAIQMRDVEWSGFHPHNGRHQSRLGWTRREGGTRDGPGQEMEMVKGDVDDRCGRENAGGLLPDSRSIH